MHPATASGDTRPADPVPPWIRNRIDPMAHMPVAVAGPGGSVEVMPITQSADLMRRMKECPHRSKSANVGCGCANCDLGKGRNGVVNARDCFACLSTSPATDGLAT